MSANNSTHFVSGLSDNLRSERQQATIRLWFAIFFTLFFTVEFITGWLGGISVFIVYGAFTFTVISFGILLSILLKPASKVGARQLGMFIDLSFITVALSIGDSVGALGYGGYLWVTIANGLRYGVNYLKFAHIASVVCFSFVLLVSDYWHQNLVLGIGLLVWLYLLPVYVSKLLYILENALTAANKANRAKSTFLANMSHEIRTPLTAIIGYAEVSLDGNQTLQERSNALKTIVRSGNHLLHVINDILDFSKAESDCLVVEIRPVDLCQMMVDVESIMKPQAERKGLRFNINYNFPLPKKLETDSVRLKQILLNLSSNAIKFTEKGDVSITVSCDSDRQNIQFIIQDTGIGMTEMQLKRLFKPFQQADNSITRRFGGTGLGLSLSKQLADMLGGSIVVESKPGEGTCFILNVDAGSLVNTQFVKSLDQIALIENHNVKYSDKATLSGRILLAEDNPTNRQLLTTLLRNMGADVEVAENGEIAVLKASENQYDLILMDMQMPLLSGVDATRKLRSRNYNHPIVALTANATTEDKLKCESAGCNGFLTKPVPREKLYDVVSIYLQRAKKTIKRIEPIYSTLLSDDPDFRDIVEKFVLSLPENISKLYLSYQEQDWDTLKDGLHNMKGMGGGFGYQILTELAGKAEFQVYCENYGEAKKYLDEMSQASESICEGFKPNGNNNVISLNINRST